MTVPCDAFPSMLTRTYVSIIRPHATFLPKASDLRYAFPCASTVSWTLLASPCRSHIAQTMLLSPRGLLLQCWDTKKASYFGRLSSEVSVVSAYAYAYACAFAYAFALK